MGKQCWLKDSFSGQTSDSLSESGTCVTDTTPQPSESCTGPTQDLDWLNNNNIEPMGNNNIKSSAYECKQQCESMSNCKAYTWKTDSKQCWLKSSFSGQTSDCLSESGTCITDAMLQLKAGGDLSVGGTCTGPTQDLDWSNNVNIEPMGNNNIKNSAYECKQQCESMSNCKAYTWKTDSKQCWLKSSFSG